MEVIIGQRGREKETDRDWNTERLRKRKTKGVWHKERWRRSKRGGRNKREKTRERKRLPQKHGDPEIQKENHRDSEKPRKASDNGEFVILQCFEKFQSRNWSYIHRTFPTDVFCLFVCFFNLWYKFWMLYSQISYHTLKGSMRCVPGCRAQGSEVAPTVPFLRHVREAPDFKKEGISNFFFSFWLRKRLLLMQYSP